MANTMTDILAAVYALIDTDATFVNVYSRHGVANITLPAVTVGPVSMEPRQDEELISGGETLTPWDVTVGLRVHTSYAGWPVDQAGTVTLVDQLRDKMRENIDAVTGCHVLDVKIEYEKTFEESQTVGAQVNVTLLTHAHYTQE